VAEPDLDFSMRRLDDAELSGSRFHAANLQGTRFTDAWICDTEISGDLKSLTVNGVDVVPLVAAELDRRYPERQLLGSEDPAGLSEAWAWVETQWVATLTRARKLPEPAWYESVDGEWSFTETLRHLIHATDCWLGRMIRGEANPFHRWGIAGYLRDPSSIGLDPSAVPSLDEVLVVRAAHQAMVRETIAAVTPEELQRICDPPKDGNHPQGPHSVRRCLHVILNEEWEHGRYANRDLAVLESAAG